MDERYLQQAEELAAAEIAAGVHRAGIRELPPSGFDGACECGDPIPQKRIDLGYYRCLECQSAREQKSRLAPRRP